MSRRIERYGIPPVSNPMASIIGTVFGRKLAESARAARDAERAMAADPGAFAPVRAYVIASSTHERQQLQIAEFCREAVPAAEKLETPSKRGST